MVAIFEIVLKVLSLLGLYKQQQANADMRGQGVVEQKAAQLEKALEDVQVAETARAAVDAGVSASPGSLWDDDGFERKPPTG